LRYKEPIAQPRNAEQNTVVRWACEKIKNSKKIAVNREEDWFFYSPDTNEKIEEFYQKCVNAP
jgi:hypothetical protein